MAALLTLESTGPRGEKLAMEASLVAEIPVGWDAELDCATFDADGLEQDELQTIVFETLAGLDVEWRSHLRVAE